MSASSSSDGLEPAKRRKLLAELSCLGGSRTVLAKILGKLSSYDLLNDEGLANRSVRTLRKDVQAGIEADIGGATTPYGPVICKLDVHGVVIEAVNPFAYTHVLCQRHSGFFQLLCPGGKPTTRPIVLYIDEVRPGNPLRPDKSRQTQCVYWTFADIPDKNLCNDDCWLLGTVARST